MSTGKFFTESEFSIRDRLANLSPGDYEREAKKLIERFFLRKINISDHLKMVQSTYVPRYEMYFWTIYWEHVQMLFLDAARIDEFIDLLSFWFEDALSTYSNETPYLAPTFFLDLPTFIEDMSKKKEYKNSFIYFHLHGKKKHWYPIVAAHFEIKKDKGFLGIIRNR